MGFSWFHRKTQSPDTQKPRSAEGRKPTSAQAPVSSLVRGLISNDEPTFLASLQRAVSLAEGGNYQGIEAIREAIRIRSGKASVEFYQPGIRLGFGNELFSRYAMAQPALMEMARKNELLANPRVTGDHISALMFSSGAQAIPETIRQMYRIGGLRAGFEFQLLCNELRSSSIWNKSHGE